MIFLKSEAPHGTDPSTRAVMDHERAGIRVGGSLRSFSPGGEGGKPYRPLRSSSLSSLLHALGGIDAC